MNKSSSSLDSFDLGDIVHAFKGTAFHECMEEIYQPKHSDLILEAGCGIGKLGIYYATRGSNVVLVDVDEEQIKRALRLLRMTEELFRIRLPVILRVEDARNLPFVDSSFDFVFSEGVAEHWVGEERIGYLKEMARASRNCMAVAVPDGEDPESQRRAKTTSFQYKTMPEGESPPKLNELTVQLYNAGWNRVVVKKFQLIQGVGFLLGAGFK